MIRPLYFAMLRLTKQIEKQPASFLSNTDEPEEEEVDDKPLKDKSASPEPSKPERTNEEKYEMLEMTIE